jgi:hypothetical protein
MLIAVTGWFRRGTRGWSRTAIRCRQTELNVANATCERWRMSALRFESTPPPETVPGHLFLRRRQHAHAATLTIRSVRASRVVDLSRHVLVQSSLLSKQTNGDVTELGPPRVAVYVNYDGRHHLQIAAPLPRTDLIHPVWNQPPIEHSRNPARSIRRSFTREGPDAPQAEWAT